MVSGRNGSEIPVDANPFLSLTRETEQRELQQQNRSSRGNKGLNHLKRQRAKTLTLTRLDINTTVGVRNQGTHNDTTLLIVEYKEKNNTVSSVSHKSILDHTIGANVNFRARKLIRENIYAYLDMK